MTFVRKLCSTQLLLRCGVVGPLLFIAVFMVEGLTRPDYDPYHSMVSELELSSWGWQQVANFLMCATAMLAGTIGLRRAGASGLAAGILTITALGMFMAGVFLTDPGLAYPADAPHALPSGAHTWHGLLHGIAGAVVFFSLPVAAATMSFWFLRHRQLRWAAYTLSTLVVGFGDFMISMAYPEGPAGVFQRIAIIAYFTWFSLVSLHFLRAGRQRPIRRTSASARNSPADLMRKWRILLPALGPGRRCTRLLSFSNAKSHSFQK